MISTEFAALLDCQGTLLVVCGHWTQPQEVSAWASELVQAGHPVAVRAIVPATHRPAGLAMLLAELCSAKSGGAA